MGGVGGGGEWERERKNVCMYEMKREGTHLMRCDAMRCFEMR